MFLPLIICCILSATYVLLMIVYRIGWTKQPTFMLPAGFVPDVKISVVIPARNEAHNIAALLDSILNGNYPSQLLEIIVVDDHSTDSTAAIVRRYEQKNVHCIDLAATIQQDASIVAYKKKALEAGISAAQGELVVTTDADCVAPEEWLMHIAACYRQNNAVMVIAPVDFTNDGSLVQLFQSIDFMSMQGITVAAHRLKLGNMSNGANLAFRKKAFDEVEGYKGVDHLASGDDYLLMMKMQQRFPGRVACLKSRKAIMRTAPQPDWKGFLMQRIRWASKSGKYNDKKLTAILMLVYLFNLSFLFMLCLCLFGSFDRQWLIGLLLIKTFAELFYLFPVTGFFGKRYELGWFFFLQPLHILYIISAGFLGFFGKYQWKGRSVN